MIIPNTHRWEVIAGLPHNLPSVQNIIMASMTSARYRLIILSLEQRALSTPRDSTKFICTPKDLESTSRQIENQGNAKYFLPEVQFRG